MRVVKSLFDAIDCKYTENLALQKASEKVEPSDGVSLTKSQPIIVFIYNGGELEKKQANRRRRIQALKCFR